MSPNTSSYEQTLPAYVCRTYKDQCVARNPDDLDAQKACLAVECGQKALDDASSSSSSSASSSSATASATSSGSSSDASETASSTSGGDDSASQTSSDEQASATAADSAAAALSLAGNYGTGILAVGILAAFGFAL